MCGRNEPQLPFRPRKWCTPVATCRKTVIKTFSATCSQNHHVNPLRPSPCIPIWAQRRQATSFVSVPCTRARIAYSLSCLRRRLRLAALATLNRSRVVGCFPVAFIKLFETDPPPALTPFLPIQSSHFNLGRLECSGREKEGTKAKSCTPCRMRRMLCKCGLKLHYGFFNTTVYK